MAESSTRRKHSRGAVTPRLLTRRQAAEYCSVSIETFAAHCPVRPISLGPGKRLERYDIVALDHWIDLLNGGGVGPSKDWLAALEDEDDGGAH
jgi:hypothetical protein